MITYTQALLLATAFPTLTVWDLMTMSTDELETWLMVAKQHVKQCDVLHVLYEYDDTIPF